MQKRFYGRTLAIFLPVALVVAALDQASKLWAIRALAGEHDLTLWAGRLYFSLAKNTGAAFSMFAEHPGILTALASVVAVAVLVWLARTPKSDWATALALSLILGGAAGNLIDRFRFGEVTDFIQFIIPLINRPWPTFNVADSSICVGMAALLLATFLPRGAAAAADGMQQARPGAEKQAIREAPTGK